MSLGEPSTTLLERVDCYYNIINSTYTTLYQFRLKMLIDLYEYFLLVDVSEVFFLNLSKNIKCITKLQ